MSRWIESVLGAAMIAMSTGTVRADVMIVRAIGPSASRFVAGRTLPGTTRIVLRAGDQLVLLDAAGTRSLRGPGSFVAGDAAVVTASLADLAANRTEHRARIGAVRNVGPGGSASRPNIWFVDMAAGGTMCITDPKAVTLWRGDSATSGTSVIDAGTAGRTKLDWIKGQASQAWPAAISVTGSDYLMTGAGASKAGTTIRFQIVAQPPADLQQLASALVANHCQGQLDVLIATSAQ